MKFAPVFVSILMTACSVDHDVSVRAGSLVHAQDLVEQDLAGLAFVAVSPNTITTAELADLADACQDYDVPLLLPTPGTRAHGDGVCRVMVCPGPGKAWGPGVCCWTVDECCNAFAALP